MPNKIRSPYLNLDAFDSETNQLNVIVDTPKGSRNKYTFDEKLGLFKLSGVLPAGANFPYDFGFVPSTLGGDGDPLDVLVLMDDPAFVGCLVPARLLGVIEAEQTERNGDTMRNDRLIAVAADSITHQGLKSLASLDENLVEQIEHFFVSYNEIKGKQFKTLGRFGPTRGRRVVEAGIQQALREQDPPFLTGGRLEESLLTVNLLRAAFRGRPLLEKEDKDDPRKHTK